MDTTIRNSYPSLNTVENKIFCNNGERTQIQIQVIRKINEFFIQYNISDKCLHEDAYRVNISLQKVKMFVNELINNVNGKVEYGASLYQLAYNLSSSLPLYVYPNVVICDLCDNSVLNYIIPLTTRMKCWCHKNYIHDYNDLFELIDKDTTMVILPHVSKVTGTIMDLEYIVKYIRSANTKIKVMVDGTAYIPHRCVDVAYLDVDYYFFTFNECFGSNIACLYIKDYDELEILDNQYPNKKLEMGTQMDMNQYGLQGLIDYMDAVTKYTSNECLYKKRINKFYNLVYDIEECLIAYFVENINNMKGLCKIISDYTKDNVSIFALKFEKFSHQYVSLFLSECNVICEHGTFNCNLMFDNNEDCIRISLAHYNTIQELEYILNLLKELNKTNNKKHAFLTGMFTPISVLHADTNIEISQDFIGLYDLLSRDIYDDKLTKYVLYSMVYTRINTIIGYNRFVQPNNKGNTNSIRHYQPINIIDTDILQKTVKTFEKFIYDQSLNVINYLFVYQIRLCIDDDLTEYIHTTGFSYVGILCVNKMNIDNGYLKLYDNVVCNELFTYNVTQTKFVMFDDRKVMHKLCNFKKINTNKDAFIDLLILNTAF
jgi:selenocysteine lyase/cysteine desulfurase